MMRLLKMTGRLGLVLGLMLLPMGCSGSDEGTTSSPLPSTDPALDTVPVEVSFTTDSDGRFELSGEPEGFGARATRDPAHSAGTPDAKSSPSRVVARMVDLRVPAAIDEAQAHLTLRIHIDEETKVLDRSGAEIPLSQGPGEGDWASAWTATARASEDRRRLYALELRQVERPDTTLPPPVVSGLLVERPDGLLDVPGEPFFDCYEKGEGLILMDQSVWFDGGWAEARCSLAIDDHSEVATTPRRQGSKDDLLGWVNLPRASEYEWRATARLEEDGTLTLVKLVGSAPPVGDQPLGLRLRLLALRSVGPVENVLATASVRPTSLNPR